MDLYGNLPAALDLRSRLAIESIIISCRILDAEFRAINASVYKISYKDNNISLDDDDKLQIFRSVWSIIDRLDHLRQVIHGTKDNIGYKPSAEEAECLRAATAIRNGMDHPLGLIAKISKNTKRHYPIYGLLWFDCNTEDCFFEKDGKSFMSKRNVALMSISSVQLHWKGSMERQLAKKFYRPFGNFILDAFDETITISDALLVSRNLQEHIATSVAGRIVEQFGQDYEKINGPYCALMIETYHSPLEVALTEYGGPI